MDTKLFINGEIGWWAETYKDMLFSAPAGAMTVYIDSVGGSVTDGNSIAALLREHAKNYNTEVETVGIGLVASIATMVLLAGTKVTMDRDAMLMIHNPLAQYVSGESDDLRKVADTLDTIKAQLAARYLLKIEGNGKLIDDSREKTMTMIVDYMENEKWFSAQEALDIGLIDSIKEDKNAIVAMQEAKEAMPEAGQQRASAIINSFKNKPHMETKNEKGFFAYLRNFFVNELESEDTKEETTEEVKEPTNEVETAPKETKEDEGQPNLNEELEAKIAEMQKALEAKEAELKASQEKVVKMQAKVSTKQPNETPTPKAVVKG
jgi:ATP-dependent protease ClpP protease subunit/uncharacterized coiled-coil protein SlyX